MTDTAYTARLQRRTWLTEVIIAANVIVFAVMVFRGVDFMRPSVQSILDAGANFAPRTTSGEWWRLFTAMFIHYGVIHLAMNMFVFFDVGRFVERRVGPLGLLAIYLPAGLAGSLASLLWRADAVSAGASGAVFGAYGAFVAFLVRDRGSMPRALRDRLVKGAAMFLVINLVWGFASPQIDMAAHVGGLVAGLALGFAVGGIGRNAVTLVAAVAVVALATRVVPQATDLQPQLEAFDKVHKQVATQLRAAGDEEKLAEVLDREVLPAWDAELDRLEALGGLAPAQRAHLKRVIRYGRVREEAWTLARDALRTGNADKTRRAEEKAHEADELWDALTKPGP